RRAQARADGRAAAGADRRGLHRLRGGTGERPRRGIRHRVRRLLPARRRGHDGSRSPAGPDDRRAGIRGPCRPRRRASPRPAARRARAALVCDRVRGVRRVHCGVMLFAGAETVKECEVPGVDAKCWVLRRWGHQTGYSRVSMKRVVLAVFLLLTFYSTGAPAAPQAAPPKRRAGLRGGQMRADYLVRYAPLLQHGLKRLTTEGAWYRNAAYPYMTTVTCVGHATIGTGTLPYKHGMIGNGWYDRPSQKAIACTSDSDTT